MNPRRCRAAAGLDLLLAVALGWPAHCSAAAPRSALVPVRQGGSGGSALLASSIFGARPAFGSGPGALAAPQVALRLSPAALSVPGVALSPAAVVPSVTAVPGPAALGAPAVTAVSALAGLESWSSEAPQGKAPDPQALAVLWDGASHKAPVAAILGEEPALAVPAQALEPARAETAEPGSSGAQEVPGSVFGWRPVQDSPDHGVAPLDSLIRKVLGWKSHGLAAGFTLTGPAGPDTRVFLYGERHTDKALIAENMRRLAGHIRPGQGAMILEEGYFGPTLRGRAALEYLEAKGIESDWLAGGEASAAGLEIKGWDDKEAYDASKHPYLQHHMNLLDINQHLYSGARGWPYYVDLGRKAYAAFRNWLVVRRLAIAARNGVLDASIRDALAESERTGKTLHVIAGSEHLLEKPYWLDAPLFGRIRMRKTLRESLGAAPAWAAKPADSAGR